MAIAKKKRKFFDVEMPLINKTTQLFAFKPEELEGRIITYDLTRILKGKAALLKLDVISDGEKITTKPRKLKLMRHLIKNVMRKGTDYVENSFKAECKDAVLTIKPFLVTRRRVTRKVKKGLREKAKKELKEYVKDKKYEDLFDEILKNKLQRPLSLKLKKVYPLSLCEIRILEVVEKKDNKNSETEKENKRVSEETKKEVIEDIDKTKGVSEKTAKKEEEIAEEVAEKSTNKEPKEK